MKLSERLEAHASRATARAHWADIEAGADAAVWRELAADLAEAAQLARRVEDAPVGECVEVGSMPDVEGNAFDGFLVEATKDDIQRGPSLVYRRVRLMRVE